MMTNRLRLSGYVATAVVRKVSPSGIPHCQFIIEHSSQQWEAGVSRQAKCRLPVIISGEQHQPVTQLITVGRPLILQGFIHTHQTSNGQSQLVLHAEQIELIDSGD